MIKSLLLLVIAATALNAAPARIVKDGVAVELSMTPVKDNDVEVV